MFTCCISGAFLFVLSVCLCPICCTLVVHCTVVAAVVMRINVFNTLSGSCVKLKQCTSNVCQTANKFYNIGLVLSVSVLLAYICMQKSGWILILTLAYIAYLNPNSRARFPMNHCEKANVYVRVISKNSDNYLRPLTRSLLV